MSLGRSLGRNSGEGAQALRRYRDGLPVVLVLARFGEVSDLREEKMMNRLLLVALAIVTAWSLAACNTMRGVGKDIEKGGQAIEKAASK